MLDWCAFLDDLLIIDKDIDKTDFKQRGCSTHVNYDSLDNYFHLLNNEFVFYGWKSTGYVLVENGWRIVIMKKLNYEDFDEIFIVYLTHPKNKHNQRMMFDIFCNSISPMSFLRSQMRYLPLPQTLNFVMKKETHFPLPIVCSCFLPLDEWIDNKKSRNFYQIDATPKIVGVEDMQYLPQHLQHKIFMPVNTLFGERVFYTEKTNTNKLMEILLDLQSKHQDILIEEKIKKNLKTTTNIIETKAYFMSA